MGQQIPPNIFIHNLNTSSSGNSLYKDIGVNFCLKNNLLLYAENMQY